MLCTALFFWYIRTESFQALVRRRFVAEVERVTGGRAEIQSFHTVPLRLQVEVRGLTVHGLELEGEAPLMQVDQIVARIKVISLFRTNFGFHEVIVDHPVVHLKLSADGIANLPMPRLPHVYERTPVEQLFSLSVNQIEIRRGELLWEDQKLPLELAARDVSLRMDYAFLRNRYDGQLLVGKVDTAMLDYRPFAWMGTLAFSLGPTFVDVKSLVVSSGKSRVSASGRISDFRHPAFIGNYEARIDLGEIGAIARQSSLSSGLAEVKGKAEWGISQQGSSGRVVVRDVSWHNGTMSITRASLNTEFFLDPTVLRLSKIQASVWGGSVTGQALVRGWRSSEIFGGAGEPEMLHTAMKDEKTVANGKIGKRHAPETAGGMVELHLQNLSPDEIAESLSTPVHPLGRFHPVGSVSGSMTAQWQKTVRDAGVEFSLESAPPGRAGYGQVPVTARAQGAYRGSTGALELSQFKLTTPSTSVEAAGLLTQTSSLRVTATTSSLDEWGPLVAALGGPARLPVSLGGNASFRGMVGGSLLTPAVNGELTVRDFTVILPGAAHAPASPQPFDSFSASVAASSRELTMHHANLQRGDLSADFDGTVALQSWKWTPGSLFHLNLKLQGANLASLEAIAGYHFPVTGKVDVVAEASGTQSNLKASGQFHILDASFYSEPVSRMDSKFTLEAGQLSLNDLRLVRENGELTGEAAYKPADRSLRLDLVAKNIELASVRQIQTPELAVDGIADFTLKVQGSVDEPAIEAHLHAQRLSFDKERSGDFDADFATQGRELKIIGKSSFTHGTLNVSGKVGLEHGYPLAVMFSMDHLDLDPLWVSYLQGRLTGHSSVGGTLLMSGPMLEPAQWTLDGKLNDLSLDVEYAKLRNQGVATFRSERQSVRIDPFRLVGDGTDVTVQGTMDFSGARKLDMSAKGNLDTKMADSFVPDLAASGIVTVDVHVGGTMDEPFPQGRIQINDGAASYAGLPSGLSELNGSLMFSQGRFFIESLHGRTGGGTLEFKGDAAYFQHTFNFNLMVVGKEVRLRYPPGVSSTADATLHWVGTTTASTISGDIVVNKLAVTPGFDFSSYLARSRPLGSLVPAESPLYGVKLDVRVSTAPELQMKTAQARLSGDADLHLRGSLAIPAVLGRVDILEGDATFNGTRFHLERGDITFANPVSIEPQVNLQASTRVRNYDINLIVTGKPTQTGGVAVNYRADPPLPQSDIISLLALGRTNQEAEQLQQQSVQSQLGGDASALLLTQALNSAITSRVQRLFGVSRIKVDPQGVNTDTNALARGPQVTIEQQFANNLTLSYSTNVAQSAQQIIRGEYYFTRNVSAVGTRDRNGVVSFDVRVRRRKK